MKKLLLLTFIILAFNLFIQLSEAQSQTGPLGPVIEQQANLTRCQMASEGLYENTWVQHRIVVGNTEEVLFGADDMNSIIEHLHQLRADGICK